MRSTNSIFRGILFLILFLSASKVAAQDYLMIRPGERIKGKVIRNFEYNIYKTLKFQTDDGKVMVYRPEEIHGFELESGRLFLTQIIPGRKDPVLVQRIFAGKVNLNHYAGRYFIENEGEMQVLEIKWKRTKVNGREVMAKQRPYLSIIQYHLSGQCSISLIPNIEKLEISEKRLIEVLIRYHECEGIEYTVHVENVPLLKLSPVLLVGQSMVNMIPNTKSAGRVDALETAIIPNLQVMLRLHSFKRAPKPFFEIGYGIRRESNVAYAELVRESVRITGREEFSSTGWYLPVSLNYMFYHSKIMDGYIGAGVTIWKTSIKSHTSMIDLNNPPNTFLYEESFYGRNIQQTVPSLKLGTNVLAGTRLRIVGELKTEYFTDHHNMNLLYNRASYHQLMTSFSLGLQY